MDNSLKTIETNQEVVSIKTQAAELAAYADALVIKIEDDVKTASNMLSTVRSMTKQTDEQRRFFVDPYGELVKKINDYFRPFSLILKSSDSTISRKLGDYRMAQEAKAEKARQATMTKIEAGKITLEQGMAKLENVKEVDKTVRTSEATMTFTIVKKVEIVDASLLSREYLIPDEVKIRKVAIAGVVIPGVKVTETKEPRIRRNF